MILKLQECLLKPLFQFFSVRNKIVVFGFVRALHRTNSRYQLPKLILYWCLKFTVSAKYKKAFYEAENCISILGFIRKPENCISNFFIDPKRLPKEWFYDGSYLTSKPLRPTVCLKKPTKEQICELSKWFWRSSIWFDENSVEKDAIRLDRLNFNVGILQFVCPECKIPYQCVILNDIRGELQIALICFNYPLCRYPLVCSNYSEKYIICGVKYHSNLCSDIKHLLKCRVAWKMKATKIIVTDKGSLCCETYV